jgi:hypothetical protein
MANTNSATSHPKASAADHAPKPSAMFHTKAMVPHNINFDKDEENIHQWNGYSSGHVKTPFTSLQVLQNGCHWQQPSLDHIRMTLNQF